MKEEERAGKVKELQHLYRELGRITTLYGLNNHGSQVHTKLEEALAACRDQWKELNPENDYNGEGV